MFQPMILPVRCHIPAAAEYQFPAHATAENFGAALENLLPAHSHCGESRASEVEDVRAMISAAQFDFNRKSDTLTAHLHVYECPY